MDIGFDMNALKENIELFESGKFNDRGIIRNIKAPVTKLNRGLICELKDINERFHILMRANDVAKALIDRYCDKAYEAYNLVKLSRSQWRMIDFNKRLCSALSKHGIENGKVLKYLRMEIEFEIDRLKRNEALIDVLFNELGISGVYQKVEEDTSMGFVDYVKHLEEGSGIEEPLWLGDDESYKDNLNKYYKELTEYVLVKIVDILGDDFISSGITQSLRAHREALEEYKKNRQDAKDRRAMAMRKMDDENDKVQKDAMAGDRDKLYRMSRAQASEMFLMLNEHPEVYYIAYITYDDKYLHSVKYYLGEDWKEPFGKATMMKVFVDRESAQSAYDSLLASYGYNDAGHILRIEKLVGVVDKGAGKQFDVMYKLNHIRYETKKWLIEEDRKNTLAGVKIGEGS